MVNKTKENTILKLSIGIKSNNFLWSQFGFDFIIIYFLVFIQVL